jgi:hypothetical protein
VEHQQYPRWLFTKRQFLWVAGLAALAFLIIVICGYLYGWKWTGFLDRTLWDWLRLLLAAAVPVVIALFGQRISTLQYLGQQEAEKSRAQDEALQAYLDRIENLLLDKDTPLGRRLDPEVPEIEKNRIETVQTLARARTITLLRRLDPRRKRSVLDFLYESRLIKGTPVIMLGSPDLDYGAADLSGADLRGAVLSGADLSGPHNGANLSGANLRGAELSLANLSRATLREADLQYANLWNANLSHANLSNANLSSANLSGADLRGAMGVTREKLEQETRTHEGTILPNGQKYED